MKGINIEKIKEIAKNIMELKEKRIYPFNEKISFPDAILPNGIESGSKEHALFLLHAISMDSMSRATNVYRNVRNLFEKLDGNLSSLENIGQKEIYGMIGVNEGDIFDSAKVLIENSKLIKEYNGDPRNLKHGSLEDTIKEISKFKQYGNGKIALLIKNFVRFGMWDFSEYEIPIKIDRHAIRISLGYGAIDEKKYSKVLKEDEIFANQLKETINNFIKRGLIDYKNFQEGKIRIIPSKAIVEPLTKAYLEITKSEKISAIALDDALWSVGSTLCVKDDYSICGRGCPLKCSARYASDSRANWFFLDIDKRKNKGQYLIDFEDF